MAVKARDAAGLESSVVMSPALVVDVTPPEGITCSTYRLEAEADLSMSLTLTSLRYRTYNASMQVDLTPESQLVNVTLSATALRPGARAAVSMNSFTMPVVFMYHEEDRARSHHVLLSESGGNTRVDVWVEGNAGASITAQVNMPDHLSLQAWVAHSKNSERLQCPYLMVVILICSFFLISPLRRATGNISPDAVCVSLLLRSIGHSIPMH